VNLIKLFVFWNLDILLIVFAKIRREKVLFGIIKLLGGAPILVHMKKMGKKKWGIMYVEKIIYK